MVPIKPKLLFYEALLLIVLVTMLALEVVHRAVGNALVAISWRIFTFATVVVRAWLAISKRSAVSSELRHLGCSA